MFLAVILASGTTDIVVSLISTLGVVGVGVIGYMGIKAQIQKSNDLNTSQHGDVAKVVRVMSGTLKDVDATIGLLVSTQGFPMFKNTPDGSLIWANSAALELLGLSFDQLSDPMVWPTVLHPEDRIRVTDNWNSQILTGRQHPPIIYRYVHPVTGDVTRVRGLSRPIKDDSGTIIEWVSMVVPLNDEEKDNA